VVDYQMFANRGHFICVQPGWQEVAASVGGWLEANTSNRQTQTVSESESLPV
jgi:hypothetical protein